MLRESATLRPDYARNFLNIASRLMHWSPVLDHSRNELSDFLADFIAPFVNAFGGNMIVCFETIATILLNQCQLWFEYSPLLPLNFLGIVENLLEQVEPSLMRFYRAHGITNVTFAWHPMRAAFSHQLDEWQWLQLWDHIVSQPPHYLVFAVVAFNAVQRNAIERLAGPRQIHTFFQEASGINMKLWLRKTDAISASCPAAMHPRQYMRDFGALSDTADPQYHKLHNYPPQLLARHTKRGTALAAETTAINRKYMELERLEMDLMQQLVDNVRVDEQRRRMQRVGLEHERAVLDDVRRIEMQRQHLVLYERQLNDRVALMTTLFVEHELENECKEREQRLEAATNWAEQQV